MDKTKIVHKHDPHVHREALHYLVLFSGLVFFLFLAYLFMDNKSMQVVVFFFACAFYALWGILHHYLENHLTWLVASEYVFFAFIVFLLVVLSSGAFSI